MVILHVFEINFSAKIHIFEISRTLKLHIFEIIFLLRKNNRDILSVFCIFAVS